MRAGRNGLIMVGREWDDFHKSPLALGGINTQSMHIQLEPGEDIDVHYARAVDAGARCLRDPADQFYGDRVYGVVDPEGHQWTFGVPVKAMSQAEMAQAGGVTVKGLSRAWPASTRPSRRWPIPSRRAVVDLLRQRPHAAGELARAMGLPAPAMSRALKALKAADLVAEHHPPHDSRLRIYELRTRPDGRAARLAGRDGKSVVRAARRPA